jgi:hypothetical protein
MGTLSSKGSVIMTDDLRKLLTALLCFTVLHILIMFAVEFLWGGLIGTARRELSPSTLEFIFFFLDFD